MSSSSRPQNVPLLIGVDLQSIYHDQETYDRQGRKGHLPAAAEVFKQALLFSGQTEPLAQAGRLNRLWMVQEIGEAENIQSKAGHPVDLGCGTPQLAIASMAPIAPLQETDRILTYHGGVSSATDTTDGYDLAELVDRLAPSEIFVFGLYLDQAVAQTATYLRHNLDTPVTILTNLTLPCHHRNDPKGARQAQEDTLSVLSQYGVKTLDSSEFLAHLEYHHEDPAAQSGHLCPQP
ncbi:MAG: hypothetical protein H6855_00740 [Rhodospirillales bacterium]|nr:hypothetical protein [Rhodospirillales bacterium]MCB9964595.1 hypothetical protein [Rhodospirillales bacterium]MCB9980507.1 hypothetical protein [Rhodospirillales bacterium]